MACILAGCDGVARDVIYKTTRPTVDADCAAALNHLRECDPRFPDRVVLCSYGSEGDCAPFINPGQTQCLHESSCEAARAALDQRGWLCGLSLQHLDRESH